MEADLILILKYFSFLNWSMWLANEYLLFAFCSVLGFPALRQLPQINDVEEDSQSS